MTTPWYQNDEEFNEFMDRLLSGDAMGFIIKIPSWETLDARSNGRRQYESGFEIERHPIATYGSYAGRYIEQYEGWELTAIRHYHEQQKMLTT